MAQGCDELPIGVLCETLTDAVIGVALDEALKVSVQELLVAVRQELVAVQVRTRAANRRDKYFILCFLWEGC